MDFTTSHPNAGFGSSQPTFALKIQFAHCCFGVLIMAL